MPTPYASDRESLRSTVLIVDHDGVNRRALHSILCDDYLALAAEDASGALAELTKYGGGISLVVADFSAAETGARELLSRMSADPTLIGVPVIAVADGSDADAQAEALALGAKDVIVRPYVPAVALHRVRVALRNGGMLPYILAAIMDATTDLCFVKDRSLVYLSCSKTFAHLTGQQDERGVVGKTDYDLFPHEIAEKYRNDDIRLISGGQSLIDMIELIPSDDGVRHYSSTSKFLLRDTRGEIVGLYGMGRDITEHREAYARLKLLTDTIPGGLAMYELSPKQQRILYFSDGFFTITGYTKEEYQTLAKKDPFCLILREDMHIIRDNIAAVLAGADSFDYIYRASCKSGGYRWLNLRGTVTERQGDTVIVNTVKLDVTEQKKAEEQLRMSEEQNRLALLHSGTLLCRYDVADRSVNMSPEVAAFFNAAQKVTDVPDAPVRAGSIAPESVDAYVGFYHEILRGEQTGSASFRCRTASGWRWLKGTYSTIFSDSGEPVYAVISFVDITENQEKELAYERYLATIHQDVDADADGKLVYLEADITADLTERCGGSLLPKSFPASGGSYDELLTYTTQSFVMEEERERFGSVFARENLMRLYGEGIRNLGDEWHIHSPKGEPMYLRSETQLVQDPYSGHIKDYTILRDITDEKLAELGIKK